MSKCGYLEKRNYWASISKKVMAMNDEQLIILYDIHEDFLYRTTTNRQHINEVRRYASFGELTYDKLVRYTRKTHYASLKKVVDLILIGYDYNKVKELVF